jgi:hypothetical protein
MAVSIRFNKKQDKLIVTLPVSNPRLSASGKTMVIASSRGARTDTANYQGYPIFVVANAWVYRSAAIFDEEEKKNRGNGKNRRPASNDETPD